MFKMNRYSYLVQVSGYSWIFELQLIRFLNSILCICIKVTFGYFNTEQNNIIIKKSLFDSNVKNLIQIIFSHIRKHLRYRKQLLNDAEEKN